MARLENITVLVIGVNYYDEDVTVAFVDDFLKQKWEGTLNVVIVDNGSGKDRSRKLDYHIARHQRASVYRSKRNLGFYGGINWGLERYLESNPFPDYIIASNTDIIVSDLSFVSRLTELYSEQKDVGVIGPTIISTLTGIDQNPQIESRPSVRRWWGYTVIYRYYCFALLYKCAGLIKNFLKARFSKRYRASEHPRDIYAPHGSFVVFLRDYFQKGGDLKHDAFMFGETITIAEKARKLGIRVVYDPRLRVGHAVHSTTKLFRSRKMIRYQWEAAKYVYEKYYVNSSQGTQ